MAQQTPHHNKTVNDLQADSGHTSVLVQASDCSNVLLAAAGNPRTPSPDHDEAPKQFTLPGIP